jgi:UDP-sulfoquinovose synthase
MYLSQQSYTVTILDSIVKRTWEAETGTQPLFPVPPLEQRVNMWRQVSGRTINVRIADLCDYDSIANELSNLSPDAIIHYAEQPSAPFSMIDARHATITQNNNVIGTLNLLWAMRNCSPASHLVKLGTLGQYGTPEIDIEEGLIEINHKGRRDSLPFPCQPGSFYHLSKVHDSHNIRFASSAWGLAATDLNQGIVYGLETDETGLHPDLATSFHYDAIFGTALNRFCVQAVAGVPLTLYGSGGQKRGFINIRDTLRCVEIAITNPPAAGEYRVFNQLTEVFKLSELANAVVSAAAELGIVVQVSHLANPRAEREDHYFNPVCRQLKELGLEPHLLSHVLVESMLLAIRRHAASIDTTTILPSISWRTATDTFAKEVGAKG